MVLDVSANLRPHIFSHAGSIFLIACITFLCCLPVTSARSAGKKYSHSWFKKQSARSARSAGQTLSLGQGVAGAKLPLFVSVFNQRKFAPVNFLPCWLHISDSLHHVLVLFTSHLCEICWTGIQSWSVSSKGEAPPFCLGIQPAQICAR